MHTGFTKIKTWHLLVLAAALIGIDQLSKRLADNFFSTYCNKGIAWGIELPGVFFIATWLIIVAALIYFAVHSTSWAQLGTVLIINGAISNAIDRLQHGCVVDFINFPFWPAFNLADTFIVIGGIIVLVENLKSRSHK